MRHAVKGRRASRRIAVTPGVLMPVVGAAICVGALAPSTSASPQAAQPTPVNEDAASAKIEVNDWAGCDPGAAGAADAPVTVKSPAPAARRLAAARRAEDRRSMAVTSRASSCSPSSVHDRT